MYLIFPLLRLISSRQLTSVLLFVRNCGLAICWEGYQALPLARAQLLPFRLFDIPIEILALILPDWWKFRLTSCRTEKFLPCCPVGWLKLCLPGSLWNLSISTEGSLTAVKFECLLLGLCADCSQVMAVPLRRTSCTKLTNADSQRWEMVLWISCYSPPRAMPGVFSTAQTQESAD